MTTDSDNVENNPSYTEIMMSHASMLKARRKHQKTRKLLDGEAKQAKKLAKQAAEPAVKKPRA